MTTSCLRKVAAESGNPRRFDRYQLGHKLLRHQRQCCYLIVIAQLFGVAYPEIAGVTWAFRCILVDLQPYISGVAPVLSHRDR